jgi:hypothetical protein
MAKIIKLLVKVINSIRINVISGEGGNYVKGFNFKKQKLSSI